MWLNIEQASISALTAQKSMQQLALKHVKDINF